jgi:hypothetical protein
MHGRVSAIQPSPGVSLGPTDEPHREARARQRVLESSPAHAGARHAAAHAARHRRVSAIQPSPGVSLGPTDEPRRNAPARQRHPAESRRQPGGNRRTPPRGTGASAPSSRAQASAWGQPTNHAAMHGRVSAIQPSPGVSLGATDEPRRDARARERVFESSPAHAGARHAAADAANPRRVSAIQPSPGVSLGQPTNPAARRRRVSGYLSRPRLTPGLGIQRLTPQIPGASAPSSRAQASAWGNRRTPP